MDPRELFTNRTSRLYTDEQKWAIIISMKYFNLEQHQVVEKFGACKVAVSRIWSKYTNENTVDNCYENCGRKARFSPERVNVALENAIQENRKASSSTLKRRLEEDDGIRYASPTVRKKRKVIGYVGKRPVARPSLTEVTTEARIKYCRDHAEDKFTNVLFIDESIVQMNENKEIIWYKPDDEPRPTFQQARTNHKFMIAGGISSKGKTSLKIWDISRKKNPEKVNGEAYRRFLIKAFAESSVSFGRGHFRLQHDNARPHIDKRVQSYINNKGVKLLYQPPYSPDLQPIEKVWGWMKGYISNCRPQTKEDLLNVTKEAWNKVPLSFICKLIQHHVEKLPIMLQNNGKYID